MTNEAGGGAGFANMWVGQLFHSKDVEHLHSSLATVLVLHSLHTEQALLYGNFFPSVSFMYINQSNFYCHLRYATSL